MKNIMSSIGKLIDDAFTLIHIAFVLGIFLVPVGLMIHDYFSEASKEARKVAKMEREILELYQSIAIAEEWAIDAAADRRTWRLEPEVNRQFIKIMADIIREDNDKLATYPEELRRKVWEEHKEEILLLKGILPE